MSVPRFPSVMSLMRERGGLDLCLYLASYVMSFYLWQDEKGVVLTYVSHLSQSEKGGFHICLYFSSLSQLSFLFISCKMKGVLTYVRTWLCPSQLSCLPTFRKVRKGWFLHVSVPGFPSVTSFYSSLGEKVVSTYVCTWLPSVSCPFLTSQGGKRVLLAVVRTNFSPDSWVFPDSCSVS